MRLIRPARQPTNFRHRTAISATMPIGHGAPVTSCFQYAAVRASNARHWRARCSDTSMVSDQTIANVSGTAREKIAPHHLRFFSKKTKTI